MSRVVWDADLQFTELGKQNWQGRLDLPMPNIAWVRVALHDDTQIEEYDEEEVLTLAGDSI